MSARRGWLPRAAISTSREWAAIGEVAPLLLAAGTPRAPHLRIHTINTNRLTALIPRLSSGIVRRPALHVIDGLDLASGSGEESNMSGGCPAPHPADQSRRDRDPPVGVSTAATVTTAATATPIHHAAIAVSTPLTKHLAGHLQHGRILSIAAHRWIL